MARRQQSNCYKARNTKEINEMMIQKAIQQA